MIRFLIITFLLCSCSAQWHINKAKKKDPLVLEREIRAAEVSYIHDTIRIEGLTRVTRTPIFNIAQPKTRFSTRIDKKLEKEDLKQEKLKTKALRFELDSMNLFLKIQNEELKSLKFENKKLKTEAKKEKRLNFWESVSDLFDNLPRLILLIALILLAFGVGWKFFGK